MRMKGFENLLKMRDRAISAKNLAGNAEEVIKINIISKEVAKRLDEWLDQPYNEDATISQDIDQFALRITNFIRAKLRE